MGVMPWPIVLHKYSTPLFALVSHIIVTGEAEQCSESVKPVNLSRPTLCLAVGETHSIKIEILHEFTSSSEET
jgi:hypothetical protein